MYIHRVILHIARGTDMNITLWRATWQYSIKLKTSPTLSRHATSRYMPWSKCYSLFHGTVPDLELILLIHDKINTEIENKHWESSTIVWQRIFYFKNSEHFVFLFHFSSNAILLYFTKAFIHNILEPINKYRVLRGTALGYKNTVQECSL